jgi:hypothetical protein
MIKISLQLDQNYNLKAFSQEDLDDLKTFKPNQVIRAELKGVKKSRSLKQLRQYWVACKTVSDNTERVGWQTKNQVDFQCRVACKFYDPDLIIAMPDGSIAFNYRSISFVNLGHIEACDYFNQAFKVMANCLGITVEELLKN